MGIEYEEDETLCDGLDNDCDGSADEGIVELDVVCGLGVCQRSAEGVCIDRVIVDECTLVRPLEMYVIE